MAELPGGLGPCENCRKRIARLEFLFWFSWAFLAGFIVAVWALT